MRKLLLLISIVASLGAAEYLLFRYYPQKTYSKAFSEGYNCFKKSPTTVFTLKPDCTMPFIDFDNKRAILAHVNKAGYRGADFTLQKKPQQKRVLISGDSFILGFGVGDTDVVSVQLENQLKNVPDTNPYHNAQVINAGYAGGFGPDGYFLHLKKEGVQLAPDLVVFSIFTFNDLSDIADDDWTGVGPYGEPEKIESKTTFVDDRGYLLPKTMPIIYRIPYLRESNVAVLLSDVMTRLYAFAKTKFERVAFIIFPPTLPNGNASDSNLPGIYRSSCIFDDICHRTTMHLFSDLLATVKASKAVMSPLYSDTKTHFVVLLIPADFQLDSSKLGKYGDAGIPQNIAYKENPNPQRRIKEMLDQNKIAYIDLLPLMRKEQTRLYFQNDGHWNAAGHAFVAQVLSDWIVAQEK